MHPRESVVTLDQSMNPGWFVHTERTEDCDKLELMDSVFEGPRWSTQYGVQSPPTTPMTIQVAVSDYMYASLT
jgi:hypothetical protein